MGQLLDFAGRESLEIDDDLGEKLMIVEVMIEMMGYEAGGFIVYKSRGVDCQDIWFKKVGREIAVSSSDKGFDIEVRDSIDGLVRVHVKFFHQMIDHLLKVL